MGSRGMLNILIVDDELVSRKKMHKIMQDFGHCDVAENAQEAIRFFQSAILNDNPYNLVLLDISMPEMEGTEGLMKMRKMEKKWGKSSLPTAKYIMVTSHSDKDSVCASITAGCDEFIVKPFSPQTMFEKMQKLRIPGIQIPDSLESYEQST